jgi:hypothetical protein
MYWIVPRICPSPVSACVSVFSVDSNTPERLARPKSRSLTPCLVDDSLAMGFGERVEDLAGEFDSFGGGEGTLEGSAVDELHDEVVGADVVELADVGVVESGNGLRFACETLGELLAENLDGDGAIKARVAGFVDFAHAPGVDGRKDLEVIENLTRLERHDWNIIVARRGEAVKLTASGASGWSGSGVR